MTYRSRSKNEVGKRSIDAFSHVHCSSSSHVHERSLLFRFNICPCFFHFHIWKKKSSSGGRTDHIGRFKATLSWVLKWLTIIYTDFFIRTSFFWGPMFLFKSCFEAQIVLNIFLFLIYFYSISKNISVFDCEGSQGPLSC